MNNCPCGSGSAFEACCGPILAGAPAPTAEALMRSRYTAYVKREYAHLGTSLSTEQRKDYSPEDAKSWAEKSEWLGLTIHGTSQGGVDDTTGLVDFSAKFKTQGQEQEHRETAIFNRENGRWVYSGHTEMAGTPVRRESPKVGRNDPCPCGSGKKFKKCCGGV